MSEYKTVTMDTSDEFVEKRSRFIGYIRPVKTEEEAIAFINQIKSKHWDATHNVYAYCLREGQVKRYSDDGEPQGTAGIPTLDVLLEVGGYRCGGGNYALLWRYFTWRRWAGNQLIPMQPASRWKKRKW